MKNWVVILSSLFLFGFCETLTAQDCSSMIFENKVVGGIHVLRTNPQIVVVRGTYTYSIDFRSDNLGLMAKVYSQGGEIFNQNDEMI
ncbi:MAG: hypothetical protein CO161_01615, partial [Candidatus Portnoybacteria bacterium CG_4_9_14_3_um_filter_44_9]